MDGKSGRLLLVNAEGEENRALQWLVAEKYDLTVAIDGSAALRRLQEAADIDLVLLQGSPPDMSNMQLCRSIREGQAGTRLPLIMLCKGASPDVVAKAFVHGADNCLTAPPVKSLLKARVEALLQQKRSFEQAKAKQAELEETEHKRLQTLRMATHDVQSPLNNIRLAEQILRRVVATERPEVLQSLNMIRSMTEGIGELLANYLESLELQTGLLEYILEPVNLRDAIVNVCSQHEFAASKKGISLQVVSASGWVTADAQRIVQALANLVSNAIKYSPYDSVVQISTAREGGYRVVAVADRGPGIPEEERPRLFQEFGKLSTQPTGGESRTGLGLWIVKQLVKAQAGLVGADFPAAGGSRFWFALPLASKQ